MWPRSKCARFLLISAVVGANLWGCSTAEDAPEEPTLAAPEQAPTAEPAPERPARPREDEVFYTIARGGTLRNVANLYKLHHHEIIELNPGVDPDTELGPDTKVRVYDYQRDKSESIGLPHAGKLVGAMPMLDGPGRKITAQRWKTWATRDTVHSLDKVLRLWAKQYPEAPIVLVGNLSARHGGPLEPHKTHQSGRDVDISYIANWDGKSAVAWQRMSEKNLDASRTWDLLKLLDKHAEIEAFFIDRSLQRVLLKHAKKHGSIRKDRLRHWLQVANPKGSKIEPKIKHVPGHKDHIHVRFACPESQTRCE